MALDPVGRTAPFSLESTRRHGAIVLTGRGELDIAAAPQLRDQIAGAMVEGEPEVVCDMANVTFVDSSGLSVLVSAHKRGLAAAVHFVIANPRPQLLRLLEVSGTRDYLVVRQGDGGAPAAVEQQAS